MALPDDSRIASDNPSETLPNDEWQPLGAVIQRLKADVERAIAARDEAAASEAHADLVDAEHQARVIATVRRLAE